MISANKKVAQRRVQGITQAPSKPKPEEEWGRPLQRFRDMPGESQDHRTKSYERLVVQEGSHQNVSSNRIDSRFCSPVVRTWPAQWANSTRFQWSTANVPIPPCHKSQKSSQNLQRFRTMRLKSASIGTDTPVPKRTRETCTHARQGLPEELDRGRGGGG